MYIELMVLFEKDTVDKIAAFERVDRPLTVVGFKGWLVLAVFLGLTVLTLFWSVWGTIPITLSGKALVFNPDSAFTVYGKTTGIVSEIRVFSGAVVHQGDVIAILQNEVLKGKLEDQKRIVQLDANVDERTRLLEQRTLAQLQEEVDNLVVRAPEEGKIVWVNLTLNSEVHPGLALFSIQQELPLSHLKILGFFPLHSAESIQEGMEVKCALDAVPSQRFGMLEGVVKEVLPYPLSADERYMQKIPSQPLREYLLGGPLPVVTVVINPKLNPNTPSGLQWTSTQGPPAPLTEVSIGEAMVILENAKPISFLLPGLR